MDETSHHMVRGRSKEGREENSCIEEIANTDRRPWETTTKKWLEDATADKPQSPPQLIIDPFSFEELHSVMKRNGGQMLGLFDEMSSLYAQLDLFKHGNSTMDRKTLITLNGGGAWARNYRSYTAVLEKTAFNIAGTIFVIVAPRTLP